MKHHDAITAAVALLAFSAVFADGPTRAAAPAITTVDVDATQSGGRVLPNFSKTLVVWNGVMNDRRESTPLKPPADASAVFPITNFVEWVELIACTGGNYSRDLLLRPDDARTIDDYDFMPLLEACAAIRALGAKPYLKLGNVPKKYSISSNRGDFSVNCRPTRDDEDHYRYMKACAAALRKRFGRDEVRSWRFSVLTEANNPGWFRAKGEDEHATRDAFFRLYDWTARAFEEELGKGLVFGTHLLDPGNGTQKRSFEPEDFLRHCSKERNFATGRTGAPLRLLTISHYVVPESGADGFGRIAGLARLRETAAKFGFTDLVTGVDEGRVLYATQGRDAADLSSRIVGQSYQSGLDVRFAAALADAGADYFASWGYFSGPDHRFSGLPSHHYFSSRELAKLAGMHRVPAVLPSDAASGVDALAGVSEDGRTVRVAVGRFHDRLAFDEARAVMVNFRLPADWAGSKVKISFLTLDDRNNWFVDWLAERERLGIGAGDFRWSPDDVAAATSLGLTSSERRQDFVKRLQPAYAAKAVLVKPTAARTRVKADGTMQFRLDFKGNGAAFVSIVRL